MSIKTIPSIASPAAVPLVYTPEEAATALKVSRTKIYALLRTGAIRSFKIGGSRRIARTAIESYVADLDRRGEAA